MLLPYNPKKSNLKICYINNILKNLTKSLLKKPRFLKNEMFPLTFQSKTNNNRKYNK